MFLFLTNVCKGIDLAFKITYLWGKINENYISFGKGLVNMEKYIYRKRETDSIEVVYILDRNTVLDELRKVFGFQFSTFQFCKQNRFDDLESIYNHFISYGNFLSLEAGNTIESSLELIEFCEFIKEYSNITEDELIITIDDSEVEEIGRNIASEEFTNVIEEINEKYDISLLDEFPNLYSDYANKSISLFSVISYVLQIWRGLLDQEQSFLKYILKNNSFSFKEYSGISKVSMHNAKLLKTDLLKKLSLDTSSPLRYLPSVFQGRCSIDFFQSSNALWILDQNMNNNLQVNEKTRFPLGFTCLILSSYRQDLRWLKLEELSIQKRIQNYFNIELFVDKGFDGVDTLVFAKTIFHYFEQLFDVEREYYERKNISSIIKEFASDVYVEEYSELVNVVRYTSMNNSVGVGERIQLVSKLRNDFKESFKYYFTIVTRILEYFYNSNDYKDASKVSVLLEGGNKLGVRKQIEEIRRLNLDDIQLFPNDWNVKVVEHPYFNNSLIIYGENVYKIRNKLKYVAKYYRNINIGGELIAGWIIPELKYTVLLSYYGISNFLLLKNIKESESREILVKLFNRSPNALLISNISELVNKIIDENPNDLNELKIVIKDFDSTLDINLLSEIAPLILMVLDS